MQQCKGPTRHCVIYSIARSLPTCSNFGSLHMVLTSPGVDKGSALQLLCNHLNTPVQDTIAFGDGENDKEFLAIAGLGCAMKNARPAAKSAANVVIEVIRCLSFKMTVK